MIDRIIQKFTLPIHDSILGFTVILLIILIAPLVQRKTKIPGVITLIISGMLIGPTGFNIIEMDSAVKLFSTIGLLYIMFLAGLELDADEFVRTKRKSILFGTLTFAFPLLIGFPICHYILEFELLTSLLTSAMLSTHTLIAYTIVSRMDLTRNEAVAITVGGTIIADTTVLIILAMVHGIESQSNGWTQWLYMGISFSLFFLFMFIVIPVISKRFLKWIENESYSHYIFVLATVFISAYIAGLIGLEPIIGAFTAGLALNRLVPKTSSLMSRLEFSGNALFIPFFLVSVGMIIDMRVIFDGYETLWIAVVLTITGLGGKWLAAYTTGKILKYSIPQRNLIFGLSSSRVAATLAVITVGYNIGILDIHILNGTIILILVSCITSTLVTEHSARKVAIQTTTSIVPITSEDRILIAISNADTMTYLADLALNITIKKSQTPIYAVNVINESQHIQQELSKAQQTLQKIIRHGAKTERKIEIIATYDPNTPSAIRRVVKETGSTDLIFGQSAKTNYAGLFFGNMMEHMMNSTNQLLLFYRPLFPIFQHTCLRVICPSHSDKEYGFQNWLQKVIILAKNLDVSCCFYSEKHTINAIQEAIKSLQLKGNFTFEVINNLATEITKLRTIINRTDLLVFIIPRSSSVSTYRSEIRSMTDIMDKENIDSPCLIISPNYHNPIKI